MRLARSEAREVMGDQHGAEIALTSFPVDRGAVISDYREEHAWTAFRTPT